MWVFIMFLTSAEVCEPTDVFPSVEVEEGGVVRLRPGLDLTAGDQILWSHESGGQSSRVAQVYQGNIYTRYDQRWTGRVQINQTTGALTISNIRSDDSGLYEAFIVINRKTSKRQFIVDVYAPVSSVTEQQSVLLSASHSNTTPEPDASQASKTTNTNQTKDLHPPKQGCLDDCGGTVALVRLVLSGLVGIATVFFLVDHVRICSSHRRDSSV